MKEKNIAIFIDSLSGGGAEKVMLTLASGLKKANHNVHFFLLKPLIEYSPSQEFPVHVLYQSNKHRKSTNMFNIRKTAADMKALVQNVTTEHGEFDLHLANLDATSKVLSYCNFQNTYYVLHNALSQELKREAKLGPIKYFRKKFAKKAYNGKDLIAVSDGVKNETLTGKYIKAKSAIRIYNPNDIENVAKLAAEPNTQIPNEPYLVHAGRAAKQKRHDILFQALALVPKVKLVLLCKHDKKVRKIAAKYGVEDRIITPGFQENPYSWVANAKLLVSSSDYEGLPTTLIESLICKTPVVSTDCDYGPSEILTGEQANFLVPVQDPKALAEKIIVALDTPPAIDHDYVKQQFSIEAAVDNYLKLIKD